MTVTPYLWDSRNIYSKYKGRFSADATPILVRQVERRHKAGFGAAGLGTAQSCFLEQTQSRFWSGWFRSAPSRFLSRHKAGFGAVGLGSAQSQFWSRHIAGLGAAGYKTGLVSRQVLHLLSRLQNWISPQKRQYKTCKVSNTKIDCVYINIYIYFLYIYFLYISIYMYIYICIYGLGMAQSCFLEQTQSRFWGGWFRSAQSRFWSRHKASFGAVGLVSAQSPFWSRNKAGFGAVGLWSAQSRFWSRHKAGFGAVGVGSAQRRFWSRHKAGFGVVGLGSAQRRFWSRHIAGLGAAGYKTGLVSRQVLHLLSKLQNWISPKKDQYKTCIVWNTNIDCVYLNIYIFFIYFFFMYIDIYVYVSMI